MSIYFIEKDLTVEVLDSFPLCPYGTVVVISSPRSFPRSHRGLIEELGLQVLLDGKEIRIKAIESYCLGCGIREGETIGLLVEEI